jgi:hypothetical protein
LFGKIFWQLFVHICGGGGGGGGGRATRGPQSAQSSPYAQ